jgi:DNA-binding response OmpR family regulator
MTSLSEPIHTVLVVDDDPDLLSLTVDVLKMAGYTVLSTVDPRHALRLARTRRVVPTLAMPAVDPSFQISP